MRFRSAGIRLGWALAAFTGLGLLLFNLGSWFFYVRARSAVERELERRIILACRAAAREMESLDWYIGVESGAGNALDALENPEGIENLLLRLALREWQDRQDDIAGLFLMDPSERVIASTADEAVPGEIYPFAELDRAGITAAQSGLFVPTRPHSRAGLFFMNGYGPVEILGVPLVLGVKVDARYQRTFDAIRGGIVTANILSGAAVVALALVFFHIARRIEEQERALLRQDKLAGLGQLAAGVAHEIRNPLGTIRQGLTLFRRQIEPRDRETLEIVDEAVTRINRLVEDVLTYSRPDTVRKSSTDLNGTIDRALGILEHRFRKGGQVLVRNLKATHPVAFDAQRIEQVLVNLILNATEATPTGGRIEVKTRDTETGVVLQVEDTGTGLDPETLMRAFDPFFTRKEHGTGLGLAIASRIVEAHGGKISACNLPQGGACFRVELPGGDRT